jgi:hypothetical protein
MFLKHTELLIALKWFQQINNMKKIILIFFIFLGACQKKIGFEITNSLSEYTFRVSLSEIGSPSKMRKIFISYWDDTIIWNGVKVPPTIDTIRMDKSETYYGMDTLQRFNKYKAKNWYIKNEYQFTSW